MERGGRAITNGEIAGSRSERAERERERDLSYDFRIFLYKLQENYPKTLFDIQHVVNILYYIYSICLY